MSLSLVGLLAACGENGPDLPFVPTPEPTPEQPRDVAVSVVTRGSEEAHRVSPRFPRRMLMDRSQCTDAHDGGHHVRE